jgi:hypothetical protein
MNPNGDDMTPDTHEDEPPRTPTTPWPFGEDDRRKAAEVAAWAVERANRYVEMSTRQPISDGDLARVTAWLDIAERAERLSRGWDRP